VPKSALLEVGTLSKEKNSTLKAIFIGIFNKTFKNDSIVFNKHLLDIPSKKDQ
jgi:hypothetical protein